MELAVKAAGWVVGKALGPVTDGLLEAWAASKGLGPNVDELKVELLYAQAMLDNAQEREIHSPALKKLLHRLRQLAYDADDVLDEVEYFRIQDQLDGTYHAADEHAGGCINDLALKASHTARSFVAKLKPSSGSRDTIRAEHDEHDNAAKQGCLCSCGGRTVISPPPSPTNQDDDGDGKGRQFFCGALPSKLQGCCGKREMGSSQPSPTSKQRDMNFGCGCMLKVTSTACNTAKSIGKCLPCCSSQSDDGNGKQFLSCAWRSKVQQEKNNSRAPKLKFDRVKISTKMKNTTEHLNHVCAKVSNILNLEFMGTNRITKKEDIAKKRPMTTEYIAEDSQLYGRDKLKGRIIDGITLTNGEYSTNELVVLPIVGPGGIGKTTFTRHVYDEVKSHFGVAIWICVSLNFHASRLAHEAVKGILTQLGDEKGKGSDQELIEQKLKGKRFLLVLDDIWECHENEWRKLLAPFIKGGEKGNMVIVTTRFPKVAEMVKQKVDSPINMERLEGEDFRRFFEACIFGDQQPWNGHKDLREDGEKILKKLKGFPLEAKTVGRLLKSQFTLEHWRRVLESKEWEFQTEEDDIMPALKLSYDYLPFHLQQCFYYCALFPEDYEFESKELVHFWIGLDIVHPCDPKKRRIEDVGEDYLRDLTNHGFFKKNERSGGCPYYVIHDLLHNLAVQISSFECLSIHISNVKSTQIPQDVRHLSIIVDNKDVEDIKTFKYYKTDLSALEKRLKVENLRTLMVFGEQHGSFAKTICDLLEKARALRAICVSSYTVEDMLCNFSKLIHIRYLRIMSRSYYKTSLPGTISRLYHLKILQKESWDCSVPSRELNNLINLQHFITSDWFDTNIFNVGNLALLRELERFKAKKQNIGFELNQIAQLLELEVLGIYNLEKVGIKEEADEAKLFLKAHLRKLTLHWDSGQPNKDPSQEEQVLESLEPCGKLVELSIIGHGGAACPSWLGANITVKNLIFLHLNNVSWKNLPPLGEFSLVDGQDKECCQSYIERQSFTNLKRLELVKIPKLKKWTGTSPCELFSHLEVLIIEDCPELMELPFTHHTGCVSEHEDHMNWFPKLERLEVARCPKLSSLPCIPWSSCTCSAKITQVGSSLECLDYGENYNSEYRLKIEGKGALDSGFWMVVAFHNLSELKKLEVKTCPPLSLDHLLMLSSLETLRICDSGDAVWLPEGDGCVGYQFPVEDITIEQCGGSEKRLTRLLSFFPKLRSFHVGKCEKLTRLGVVNQQEETDAPKQPLPSKIDEVEAAQITQPEQQGARVEEEIAAAAEERLLLPPQLESLEISKCPNLVLCPYSLAGDSRGLQGLHSLQSLRIFDCPRFLSSYSSSSPCPCFPFPASLEHLCLFGAVGTATLLPISNLTSLADLYIRGCGDLKGKGLWHLLAKGCLTTLIVYRSPNFFTGSEPSPPHEQELPSSSSKLQELRTDDVAGVLAGPIFTLLSSSLTELFFWEDEKLERFTKEQEDALQLLTSLERIRFWECDKLQRLPAGLHKLPNLKILDIYKCAAIRSLPKDGLPSSLQELEIQYCPAIRSMPKECLPNSLQKLVIWNCHAIQSLPKVEDLPSSLRELDVSVNNNEKLRRQCRNFIGTVTIVKA